MLGRWLARRPLSLAALAVGGTLVSACASTSGGGGGTGGGPVPGPADTHCMGMPSQPVSQPDCSAKGDAGVVTYGATMYGAEADDDDCKYHVKWSVQPIAENQNETFTVSATYKTNGTPTSTVCSGCPITGANTQVELFLNDTHPAPNTSWTTTESPPGTYAIGPFQFDAPGKWTVRFHFFEMCSDVTNDSPHGHAAFYVDVP